MKSTKLLKSELYDKIFQFEFDKDQLILINKFIDNVIKINYLEKLTTFEEYLIGLRWGDPLSLSIIFESGESTKMPIRFREGIYYKHIQVEKFVFEMFDLTDDKFLSSLQKIAILKGSPINIMDYKLVII